MGAARNVKQDDEHAGGLEGAVRETLSRYVTGGALEEMTDILVTVIKGRFVVGTRKPRPRRETQRALMMRLPDVGVEWTIARNTLMYTLRIATDHCVELDTGGELKRYPSLKAVATAIQGYPPSVSGWQFFFGLMSREEVLERYGRKP